MIDGKEVYCHIIWHNGNEYWGYLKDNKKHGFGIYKYKCGSIYKGFWENDKKEGWGVELY